MQTAGLLADLQHEVGSVFADTPARLGLLGHHALAYAYVLADETHDR